MTIGFDQPLYLLPFDHRESFETKLFGWDGALSAGQTAEIAAAKQVIYDGFETAVLEISRRYREWVDIFEMPRSLRTESERLRCQALSRWENAGGHR